MKKELDQAYVRRNRGCYSLERVEGLSFMKNKTFHILDIVNSEIPLKDKYWFVLNKCGLTIEQEQLISINCASIVLKIFEDEYPDDKRPRLAIEAAKKSLLGNIDLHSLEIAKKNATAAAVSAFPYPYADAAYAAVDIDTNTYIYADAAATAYAKCVAGDDTYSILLLESLINYINQN